MHRWSNYLNVTTNFTERVDGILTAYAQPRFDAPDDIRILSEAQLVFQIIGPLSVTLSFRLRYDSEPPADTKSLDTEVTSGFVVVW